jgi:hypothetical protein
MTKSPESTSASIAARVYESQLEQAKQDYQIYAANQRRQGKEPESFSDYAQTRLAAVTPSIRR